MKQQQAHQICALLTHFAYGGLQEVLSKVLVRVLVSRHHFLTHTFMGSTKVKNLHEAVATVYSNLVAAKS